MVALLVYDWLLCLGEEVQFIWTWPSRVTGSSLVYAFTRYAVLTSNLLSVMTTFPISETVGYVAITLTLYGLITSDVEVAGGHSLSYPIDLTAPQ